MAPSPKEIRVASTLPTIDMESMEGGDKPGILNNYFGRLGLVKRVGGGQLFSGFVFAGDGCIHPFYLDDTQRIRSPYNRGSVLCGKGFNEIASVQILAGYKGDLTVNWSLVEGDKSIVYPCATFFRELLDAENPRLTKPFWVDAYDIVGFARYGGNHGYYEKLWITSGPLNIIEGIENASGDQQIAKQLRLLAGNAG